MKCVGGWKGVGVDLQEPGRGLRSKYIKIHCLKNPNSLKFKTSYIFLTKI